MAYPIALWSRPACRSSRDVQRNAVTLMNNRHYLWNQVSFLGGIALALLGLLVITGWHTGAVAMIQVHPAFVPMQYNTALGFLLSGLGLIAIQTARPRAGGLFGLLVALIGLGTLAEYLGGYDLHIDELFMEHYVTVKTSHPGRMAPNTALCFSLGGLALVLLARPGAPHPGRIAGSVLGPVVAALGLMAFIGYVAGLETAYGWGHLTHMAVHTALGFIVLGTALLALAGRSARAAGATAIELCTLPLTTGLVVLVLALWQALVAWENQVFREYLYLQGQLAGSLRSHLPALTLLTGLLLTGLVWAVLFVAQRLGRRTRALEKSRGQLQLILDSAQEAICGLDREGKIVFANPAASRLTGYSDRELVGGSLHDLIRHATADGQPCPSDQCPLRDSYLTGRAHRLDDDVFHRRDGCAFPVEFSSTAIRDAGGGLIGAMITFQDISERKRIEQALAESRRHLELLAYFDILTELPNRRLLADRMHQALAAAKRMQTRLAVCYMDLDGFKAINDTLGHAAGDRLLVDVARRLLETIRANDTAARLGGDEFVVLLTGLQDVAEVRQAVSRLLEVLAAPHRIGGRLFQAPGSIGVSVYPDDPGDADTLLRHADQAMYLAKRRGRHGICFFAEMSPGMSPGMSQVLLPGPVSLAGPA
jgi:diguanylate cyclase (GGDEF)-like protein/PAS domain S-box-containing protein